MKLTLTILLFLIICINNCVFFFIGEYLSKRKYKEEIKYLEQECELNKQRIEKIKNKKGDN